MNKVYPHTEIPPIETESDPYKYSATVVVYDSGDVRTAYYDHVCNVWLCGVNDTFLNKESFTWMYKPKEFEQ